MPDIDGERGELIDAFLSLIDPSEHGDTDRLMHAEMVLALTVGGAALSRVKLALPDVPVKPGSVGEQILRSHDAVDADRYLDVVRTTLLALTDAGMDESFLIRSLRDEFTRHFERFADLGSAKERREQHRKFLLGIAEDPDRFMEMQQRMAEDKPELANLHPDQFADMLREMAASRLIAEPDVEEASRNWSALQSWTEDAAAVLPDEDIEAWAQRAVLRHMRDQEP